MCDIVFVPVQEFVLICWANLVPIKFVFLFVFLHLFFYFVSVFTDVSPKEISYERG